MAGAVYVGIQDPHRGPFARQRQGQIHRYGGFPYASLARGHRDDVLYIRDRLDTLLNHVGGDFHPHLDLAGSDPRELRNARQECLAQLLFVATGREAQLYRDPHPAAVRLRAFHTLCRHQIYLQIGVNVAANRFLDRSLRQLAHHALPRVKILWRFYRSLCSRKRGQVSGSRVARPQAK